MLTQLRVTILVISAAAAMIVGLFVTVSANSESAQSSGLAQRVALPENTSGPTLQATVVPTAATVGELRQRARSSDARRRVVQNAPPSPQQIPLIMGIRN
jgi:hypothetical protein